MRTAGKGFSLLPQGFALLGAVVGFRSGGSALLFVGFCVGKCIAPLMEYERGGPQHPTHGGVTFPGILFMTWRAQGVMNGWLLVFLFYS